jgi:hypothetical protein
MSELRFTNEAPTKRGWYWLKPDPAVYPGLPDGVMEPLMVDVYRPEPDGPFWFIDHVNHEEYEAHAHGRLWAGPILPPNESAQAAIAAATGESKESE